MDERQVFFKAWRFLGWIETVDVKKLARPVFESSRMERPATRVRKPLPLFKVELCLLAFFNVDTRAVPLDNVSIAIEHGGFLVQHPPIDSIGSSHS